MKTGISKEKEAPKARVSAVSPVPVVLEVFHKVYPYHDTGRWLATCLTIEEAEELANELTTQITRAKQVRAALS